MRAVPLLLLLCAPAFAQETGVQRSLLERQQATDAFDLQMRQLQEALQAPSSARGAFESRHLIERQRLDNLTEQQLREVQIRQTPPVLQTYERHKLDMERAPFRGPIVEVPVRPAPRAGPLPRGDAIRLQQPQN